MSPLQSAEHAITAFHHGNTAVLSRCSQIHLLKSLASLDVCARSCVCV